MKASRCSQAYCSNLLLLSQLLSFKHKDIPATGFLFTKMAQQTDIDNVINSITNEFTGRSISYHGSYPNECSVPVAYYVDRLRGTSPVPSMANNRADGWGVAFPQALAPHFTHERFQVGKQYPRGTILMWNSPHIAIVLHSDGSNNVQVFEQNA